MIVRCLCWRLLLAALLAAFSASSWAADSPSGTPAIGERVMKAAPLGGNLYVLNVNGGLFSVALADATTTVVYPTGVSDIMADVGGLWILRAPPRQPGATAATVDLTVERRTRTAAPQTSTIQIHTGEGPGRLIVTGASPAIVTGRAIYRSGERLALKVASDLGYQQSLAATRDGRALYLGINNGEFGGGLIRINLQTGEVGRVERNEKGGLCDGPLNTDCDPVTSLMPDLGRADCVLAAIGLQHMTSHGRVVRVCGDQIEVVFRRPITGFFGSRAADAGFDVSEAVYGLAPAPGGFYAVTGRALYKVEGEKVTETPMPDITKFGQLHVGRGLPGMIVVVTDANRYTSLSGYTPLLVPLNPN